MTDAAFLLSVLEDGEPHSSTEILRRSFDGRGHGLMVHSRAADLRAQGYVVTCERVPGKKRGEAWSYRLVVPVTPQAEPEPTQEPSLFDPAPKTAKPAWA